jgi:hypothetical protein
LTLDLQERSVVGIKDGLVLRNGRATGTTLDEYPRYVALRRTATSVEEVFARLCPVLQDPHDRVDQRALNRKFCKNISNEILEKISQKMYQKGAEDLHAGQRSRGRRRCPQGNKLRNFMSTCFRAGVKIALRDFIRRENVSRVMALQNSATARFLSGESEMA